MFRFHGLPVASAKAILTADVQRVLTRNTGGFSWFIANPNSWVECKFQAVVTMLDLDAVEFLQAQLHFWLT